MLDHEPTNGNDVPQHEPVPKNVDSNWLPLTDEEISAELRRRLEQYTFADLARRTGYHAETIRRYLQGGARIPAAFVARCAGAFDLEPRELLFSTAEPYVSITVRRERMDMFEQAIGKFVLQFMADDETSPQAGVPNVIRDSATNADDGIALEE
ncbi:MAG: helix-turn-helix transcriptional regulator [Planctomycetota bacterium]